MENKVPAAYEIEKRVIGGLISVGCADDMNIQSAMLGLNAESFHFPEAKMIFGLICDRFTANKEFDFVSLSSFVDTSCFFFFEALREDYYTIVHLQSDVDELNSYRTLRRQQLCLKEALDESLAEKYPEIALEIIALQLKKITEANKKDPTDCVDTYESIIDDILTENKEDTAMVITEISGLPPVPMRAEIIIAGRSGHGKTFFALYLMDKIIERLNYSSPVTQSLYFNLEMHPQTMLDRHSILLGATGATPRDRIREAVPMLLQRNINMISKPMITIEEIEILCRVAANKQKIGVIVVDYVGLVTSKERFPRKDLEQNEIAKRLAALSIELDCIVIGLIQVNRESSKRPVGDRCPIPSEAAEAMGTVHSSTWWIGIDQPYLDNEDPRFLHQFQIRCRKNRGDSGLFKLDMDFREGKFSRQVLPFGNSYNQMQRNVDESSWVA